MNNKGKTMSLKLISKRLIFNLGLIFLLFGCDLDSNKSTLANSKQSEETKKIDVSKIPLGQLGRDVVPLSYQIGLTLDPKSSYYNGEVSIDLDFSKSLNEFYLHGKDLTINSISLLQQGKTIQAKYQQVHESGIARIKLNESVSGKATLKIDYQAKFSESLDAIYKVKESGREYLFSQMEAISARMAFPSFDEPGFKTPFDISIISAKENDVITNTREISKSILANGLVKHQFATTKKLPTYLLTFAVGEFDIVNFESLPVTEYRNRSIPLRGIAVKGKGKQLRYALENTKPILEALESYFKTPYPYEKLDLIAAPDFAFGAMENAGAIVYRESLLLLDENSPTSQKRAYGSVHAHELGHQWFGNLVTPKWWDDIWLNEAFATWVSYKAVQVWKPEFEFERGLINRAHYAMRVDARSSARQIRNPINTNDDIMNAFDGITYSKGGGVLQMFESFLGEEAFQKGVQLHMQRYAHGNADINDFLGSLADGSEKPDLIPAFETFLYQSGVPNLDVEIRCNDGNNELIVSQKRYVPLGIALTEKQTWEVPFCYKTIDKDAGTSESCELLTQKNNVIKTSECLDSIFPNNNAAGYYRWSLDLNGWANLIENFESLNGAEQASFASNIIAAFKSNKMDSKTLFKAFDKLVTSQSWDVANIPLNNLSSFKRVLLEGKTSEEYENMVGKLYKASFEELGLKANTQQDKVNEVGTALRRNNSVRAMAIEANNAEIQIKMLAMLDSYLGNISLENLELTKGAISSDLLPIAFNIAVKQRGSKFINRIKEHALNSTDSIFRSNVLLALTSINDKELGVKIMKELLANDKVRSNEAQQLLAGFMSNSVLRKATWNWLKENLDEFLKNYSSFSIARIVSVGSYFCNDVDKLDMKDFFTNNQSKISGSPRKILETEEVVEQCIALRKAKGAEFSDALKSFL